MATSRKTKKTAKTKSKAKSKVPKRTKTPKATAATATPATRRRRGLTAAIIIVTAVFTVGLAGSIHGFAATKPPPKPVAVHDPQTLQSFTAISQRANTLEQHESEAEIQVVSAEQLNQQIAMIQEAITLGRRAQAQSLIVQLEQTVSAAEIQLAQASSATVAASVIPADGALTIPILVYHQPPPDFSAQLDQLQAKGYTTITPTQLADILHRTGPSSPPKPVLITFDDGFADQMSAFHDLQQHHMRATFYIISGGIRSRWCIGAGRRYHSPLQPPSGCGDAYLTWSQVKQLDRSGIITIGAHTVDHEDLPTDSPAIQTFEIDSNKHTLERLLGHPVTSFAYPYGAYDATTISIVQAAGFTTAVTTNSSLSQTLAGIYTLNRVRDVSELP